MLPSTHFSEYDYVQRTGSESAKKYAVDYANTLSRTSLTIKHMIATMRFDVAPWHVSSILSFIGECELVKTLITTPHANRMEVIQSDHNTMERMIRAGGHTPIVMWQCEHGGAKVKIESDFSDAYDLLSNMVLFEADPLIINEKKMVFFADKNTHRNLVLSTCVATANQSSLSKVDYTMAIGACNDVLASNNEQHSVTFNHDVGGKNFIKLLRPDNKCCIQNLMHAIHVNISGGHLLDPLMEWDDPLAALAELPQYPVGSDVPMPPLKKPRAFHAIPVQDKRMTGSDVTRTLSNHQNVSIIYRQGQNGGEEVSHSLWRPTGLGFSHASSHCMTPEKVMVDAASVQSWDVYVIGFEDDPTHHGTTTKGGRSKHLFNLGDSGTAKISFQFQLGKCADIRKPFVTEINYELNDPSKWENDSHLVPCLSTMLKQCYFRFFKTRNKEGLFVVDQIQVFLDNDLRGIERDNA